MLLFQIKTAPNVKRKRSSSSESSDSDSRTKRKKKLKNSCSSSRLQEYADEEGLQKVTEKIGFNFDEINSDDEIFIMKLPKSINAKDLLGQNISFSKKTTLSCAENRQLTCKPEKNVTNELVITKDGLKTVKCMGKLLIKESVKLRNDMQELDFSKVKSLNPGLPQLEFIKKRHPLFGADFKRKINLDKEVKTKLQDALNRFTDKKKHKKHRRKSII